MLKIREGVNLKELEKFGFRAKYDEDTGEIYKYIKENISIETQQYVIINQDWMNPCKNKNYRIIQIHNMNGIDNTLSLIYDLIQARISRKGRMKKLLN